MKTSVSLLLIVLLTISCEKAPILDWHDQYPVQFVANKVADGPDNGLDIPTCTNVEPVQFYIEWRYLSGGSGQGYHEIGKPLLFDKKTVHVEDFKLLDADRNVLYRMPRAYNGKAFLFFNRPQGTVVDVPVSCNGL
ncbi:hypothetical protein Q4603_05760 [Zobellia galactanivorans]|uniref:hypothetical protein n=1 Tax=Zobellia galactanivorans (strain DSM 12802 / CCUG 47099 / CIP 106680 / NCIMB 13871 / Dsij) TaxID=63186 RepID=UPI0026E20E13|nr:hypothetical protein [Zobellia galactanivorans]MDO6808101.1 hypothetical protein [Zobellia galactanivorans]